MNEPIEKKIIFYCLFKIESLDVKINSIIE